MNEKNPSPVPEPPPFDLRQFASKFDFVVPEALVPDLHAETGFDAIRRLVAALASVGAIPPGREAEILASVLTREKLSPTGIGRGIAIPHTKHPAIPKLVATIGFSAEGIDFESLDQRKAQLIILVLSPVDREDGHLRAMKQLTGELRNSDRWK